MKHSTVSKHYTRNDVIVTIAFGVFALLITTGLHTFGVAPTPIRCGLSLISATVSFVWAYQHFTEATAYQSKAYMGILCALIACVMDVVYIEGLVLLAIYY